MEQLLDAAARVFSDVGYQGASTNAIARAAGVSPGTLYQFFPNKEAIAGALSERLVVDLRDVHGAALLHDHAQRNLKEMLDQITDPLIDFNLKNPACFMLLKSADVPQQVTEAHEILERTMVERVKALIATRGPHLTSEELDRIAEICFAAFFGVLQVMFEKRSGVEQAALAEELKKLLYGYLAPIIGEDAPAATQG